MPVSGTINKPNGYAQYTAVATVKKLTDVPTIGNAMPDKSIRAHIQAEAQDIRWRDDGQDPSASVGMLLKASTVLEYEGNLETIRFIEAAASAKVNVNYYKY